MHSPKTPTTEETNAAPPGTFLTLNLLTESETLHKPTIKSSISIKQGSPVFYIGRLDTSNYMISDERISKLHCVITKKRHPIQTESIYESPAMGLEDVWLLDFSTNGCYVNRKKVSKGHKVKLFDGDKIHLFIDKQHHERLGYVVTINDGTGLYRNGVRPKDDVTCGLVELQDRFDKKLMLFNKRGVEQHVRQPQKKDPSSDAASDIENLEMIVGKRKIDAEDKVAGQPSGKKSKRVCLSNLGQ
ncbi:unnamed protein product [Ambrosiozyma monospora]|uniref:Unnamed protein product n=1 Tax=Ambrosiozyma monospora TaxID=43982 RepID=A0ACB5TVR0_AMBMO|nr:unnamed protein product [Ambrosiozyma monospora]